MKQTAIRNLHFLFINVLVTEESSFETDFPTLSIRKYRLYLLIIKSLKVANLPSYSQYCRKFIKMT